MHYCRFRGTLLNGRLLTTAPAGMLVDGVLKSELITRTLVSREARSDPQRR